MDDYWWYGMTQVAVGVFLAIIVPLLIAAIVREIVARS